MTGGRLSMQWDRSGAHSAVTTLEAIEKGEFKCGRALILTCRCAYANTAKFVNLSSFVVDPHFLWPFV